MITRDLVRIAPVGAPDRTDLGFARPMERDRAQQWLDQNAGRGPVQYELRPVLTCECCGEVATCWYDRENPHSARCRRHYRRNPCFVEGCKRSFKVDDDSYLANDQIICGAHWREFVPVGSPARRIYLRFHRRARRFGWNDNSYAAFGRYWKALVQRVRAKARGDVDMDEINRLMGWDQAP